MKILALWFFIMKLYLLMIQWKPTFNTCISKLSSIIKINWFFYWLLMIQNYFIQLHFYILSQFNSLNEEAYVINVFIYVTRYLIFVSWWNAFKQVIKNALSFIKIEFKTSLHRSRLKHQLSRKNLEIPIITN